MGRRIRISGFARRIAPVVDFSQLRVRIVVMGSFFLCCCLVLAKTPLASTVDSLIQTRRSVRKFDQASIPLEVLRRICDDARFAPSAMNAQPWEYVLVVDTLLRSAVLEHLAWLGGEPAKEHEPTAYIVVLYPKVSQNDHSVWAGLGAACQTILISAWVRGVGTCWIGSVTDGAALRRRLLIPDHLRIFSVIALGYPAETPRTFGSGQTTMPYRDSTGAMQVPKKPLEQILHIDRYRVED